MKKDDYNFWLAYHTGKINRKLTEKEYSEIRACEFAMHLLIPTDRLLEMCGGLDNLKNMNIYHNYPVIKELAKAFDVSEDVMILKIDDLINSEKIEKKNKEYKKRIMKKEDNIIYVKFD